MVVSYGKMTDNLFSYRKRLLQQQTWTHSIAPPPEAAEDFLPFVVSIIGPSLSVFSERALEVLQELRSLGEASNAVPGSPRWILFIEQRGRCAICGDKHDPTWKHGSLVLDHDHDTGRIRGLLCMVCNVAEPREDSTSDEYEDYRQNPPARNRWKYDARSKRFRR